MGSGEMAIWGGSFVNMLLPSYEVSFLCHKDKIMKQNSTRKVGL